jgi:hypothetical protein
MVIILSARKLCGDQASSSSRSDHAASQSAKREHAAQRTFRKLSEMWDFTYRWRGLIHHSSLQLRQTHAVSCGIRTILWAAQRSLQRQNACTNSAPTRQFVRFPDRRQRLFPKAFVNRTYPCRARAFSHSTSAPAGAGSDSVGV